MRKVSLAPLLLLVLLITAPAFFPARVYAHEAGKGWLLSYNVRGDLDNSPNPSLDEWKGTRMLQLEQMNISGMTVMSIHNSTHILFLVQRSWDPSVPVAKAGVAMAFEGAGLNGSDLMWTWQGASGLSSSDPEVVVSAGLERSVLTVVFQRALNVSDSTFFFRVGMPYEGFVKIASWDNGQSASEIDFEELTHSNLELLPQIDSYPKTPLVYSAVILVAAATFILAELRRYGK